MMSRRSKNWNEGLAKDLKNMEFAKEFIMSALNEGISLQLVLGKLVRAYGVKEYSQMSGIASPNLLRAINPKHNPTQSTLNRILKPIGLIITVKPISQTKKAA
jgi:DNA-binding phage protein